MHRLTKNTMMFISGCIIYGFLEILWRGYTHWTMILTGGICLVLLYNMFNRLENVHTLCKCVYGAGIITLVEFIVGCVVNIMLGMNVWDYSAIPFNLFGQVCVLFSTLWMLISYMAIHFCKLADYIFISIEGRKEQTE